MSTLALSLCILLSAAKRLRPDSVQAYHLTEGKFGSNTRKKK